MKIFAKVAELQGISPAARVLNMPKSKVSRRMAALEQRLGVGLLERSTRAVNVTEAGQLFLQHCLRVLEEADGALESLQQLSDNPRGHLHISTSVAIGQYLVAPHMGEFLQTYPDITVELDLNNRRVDLISEGFDLVIRVGDLDDSSLVSKRIFSAYARLYAAPGYLSMYGEPKHPDDLLGHKVLAMSDVSRSYQCLLEKEGNEQHMVSIEPQMSVNDFSTLRTVIESGAGIGHLPEYLAESAVAEGLLQPVLVDWHSPEIYYYVLYPSHRGLSRKSRVWIDFLVEKLAQGA